MGRKISKFWVPTWGEGVGVSGQVGQKPTFLFFLTQQTNRQTCNHTFRHTKPMANQTTNAHCNGHSFLQEYTEYHTLLQRSVHYDTVQCITELYCTV